MTIITGYKTYIAAALLALVGLAEGLAGLDIPGVTLDENWLMVLLGALGLGGLRAAIGK